MGFVENQQRYSSAEKSRYLTDVCIVGGGGGGGGGGKWEFALPTIQTSIKFCGFVVQYLCHPLGVSPLNLVSNLMLTPSLQQY